MLNSSRPIENHAMAPVRFIVVAGLKVVGAVAGGDGCPSSGRGGGDAGGFGEHRGWQVAGECAERCAARGAHRDADLVVEQHGEPPAG